MVLDEMYREMQCVDFNKFTMIGAMGLRRSWNNAGAFPEYLSIVTGKYSVCYVLRHCLMKLEALICFEGQDAPQVTWTVRPEASR